MTRFVIDSSGVPVLDGGSLGVRGRGLAGRGSHVHPRPACVGTAAKRGFARSAKREVRANVAAVASDIARAALRRAAARLEATARRGGVQAYGAHDGDAALVVVACDAPASSLTALDRDVAAGRAVAFGNRAQLGKLLGCDDAPAVVVRDAHAAIAIARACGLASGVGLGRAVEDG